MSFHAKKGIGILAVAVLALPVWAGNDSRTDSTTFEPVQAAKIGETQLQPGHYELRAKESGNQLEILQEGKLIATVPCSWVQLPQKAKNSEILSDKDQVTQIEFRGRSQAVKIG